VTCGVWVGFDKPRPIYRGAFSNQIALPIWADVMQATFTNYHPAKIATPAGLLRCEICSSTGLRATPKCVEVIKNGGSGEEISKRTTYFEICTQEQMPKDACDVHGGGIRTNVREVAAGEWPRAALAVDVSTHTPVEMKGPTVIGEYDPYNSLQSLTNAVAAKALAGQVAPMDSSAQVPAPVTPGETIEVRRAEAVRPVEEFATPEVPIKLDPPKPIDF